MTHRPVNQEIKYGSNATLQTDDINDETKQRVHFQAGEVGLVAAGYEVSLDNYPHKGYVWWGEEANRHIRGVGLAVPATAAYFKVSDLILSKVFRFIRACEELCHTHSPQRETTH